MALNLLEKLNALVAAEKLGFNILQECMHKMSLDETVNAYWQFSGVTDLKDAALEGYISHPSNMDSIEKKYLYR